MAVAEDEFRALVERAPDAIVVSRRGVVLYANAAAAKLLGHDDVSGLVGKPMTVLDRASIEVMQRRVQQMAATGEQLVPREYPARRRDGTEITAEIASTIIDFHGEPAVLAYARDVTERSRLRAQLAHIDRLAAFGRMAAGVAQELDHPLSLVGQATDELRLRVGAEEADLVEQVRAGLDRIATVMRDLRFFGRGDDERPGPIDLAAAIDAAERLVLHEIRPRGKLVKEYAELPTVVGVARHVEQVFVNLFLNAAHALDEKLGGSITLRARVTPDRVTVLVEDDGCGIPKDALAVLFEPFFIAGRVGGGPALGLSVCRDLVVRVGGDLVAKSTVGEGTTMEVTLPRASSDGAETAALAPPPVPSELRAPVQLGRVLVVDDELLIVQALSKMLRKHATVVAETVAARALERLLGDEPFDTVVCDVMMPGMTGIELHEQVARARPELARRFVFISGGVYSARAREYLDGLPNARLDKPFHIAELIAAIQRTGAEGR
jgi:PAS domain S-box-containing protein